MLELLLLLTDFWLFYLRLAIAAEERNKTFSTKGDFESKIYKFLSIHTNHQIKVGSEGKFPFLENQES